MPTASPKKKAAKKLSSENHDPLSSSGVSSLSGIGLYSTKKITIFKNGDRFHRGVKFVINPRVVKDLEPLMNQINERIELSHGVKKLFTADGKVIKSINQLQDGKIYVAASAQFIAMRYGNTQEKVWKPPSRKHSPIINDSRIKTARTRSQEPRRRKAAKEAVPIQVRSVSVKNLSSTATTTTTKTMANDRGNVKKTNGRPAAAKAPTKVPVKKAPPSKAPPKAPPAAAAKPKPPQASTQQPRPKAKPPVQAAPAKKAPPAPARRKTPKTAVSLASSVIPEPNIVNSAGAAAEILEFPEAKKVIDVVTIHKTPTPPKRSPSPKEVLVHNEQEEHKSASRDHSDNGEEEEEEEEEEEFSSDGEPEEEEEEASGSEVEEAEGESESEVEDEEADEEESVGTDSEVNTPSSRKSSSGESGVEHDGEHNKKDAKK